MWEAGGSAGPRWGGAARVRGQAVTLRQQGPACAHRRLQTLHRAHSACGSGINYQEPALPSAACAGDTRAEVNT